MENVVISFKMFQTQDLNTVSIDFIRASVLKHINYFVLQLLCVKSSG